MPFSRTFGESYRYNTTIFNGWDKKLAGIRMADSDNESMYFAVSERSVKHVAIWHGIFGMDAFTDEEFEKLLEYAKFLVSLRK